MKSIELTKEHKSKLLEMCKELFPEYNKNDETGFGGWYIGKKTQHTHLIAYLKDDFNDKLEDPDLYIHWFEFCILHLATAVYNKLNLNKSPITIKDFRGYLCQEADNPIEYLYELWKKY